MSRKVLIIDTTVLCCWLKVPGKETAGPVGDRWDHERIRCQIELERKNESTLVLPLATVIETGNHIAQAPTQQFECAFALGEHIRDAAKAASPWAAFTDQAPLWDSENLKHLADTWPTLAASKLSMGDVTIKILADYYASGGFTVEILTGDNGLKAYEPSKPIPVPRRRQ